MKSRTFVQFLRMQSTCPVLALDSFMVTYEYQIRVSYIGAGRRGETLGSNSGWKEIINKIIKIIIKI